MKIDSGELRMGIVPNFCPPSKIEKIRGIIERQLDKPQTAVTSVEAGVMGYGKGWRFRENLFFQEPILKRWLLEEEPAQLAANLIGTDEVWLLRDQTYFKTPGSENTPWHQDALFIPVEGCCFLTLWIPLTPIDKEEDSPLEYWIDPYPTCHLLKDSTSMNDHLDLAEEWKELGWEKRTTHGLTIGSCSYHGGWTIHGSSTHSGKTERKAFVVVYGYNEGKLKLSPTFGACPEGLRDQAHMLRATLHESCFQHLNDGDPVPSHHNPWIRCAPS